jgi:hypothetical protein
MYYYFFLQKKFRSFELIELFFIFIFFFLKRKGIRRDAQSTNLVFLSIASRLGVNQLPQSPQLSKSNFRFA